MKAIKSGKLSWGEYTDENLKKLSKQELLSELAAADDELVAILSDENRVIKMVDVPWSDKPVGVVNMLWGLDSHEVLHTGWNIAVMDHLGMERFKELKEMWGE